jgi:hypothetical protein
VNVPFRFPVPLDGAGEKAAALAAVSIALTPAAARASELGEVRPAPPRSNPHTSPDGRDGT